MQKQNGIFDFGMFIENMFTYMVKVGQNIGMSLTSKYAPMFWKTEGYFSIIWIFFIVIGLIRTMPKHEFSDIEHGSSDWAEGGEEYSILSPKKGILLAEKHYLPVDKRGNTNVLVVGRFWFSENLHHMLYQMPINFWGHMFLQILKVNYMIKQLDI